MEAPLLALRALGIPFEHAFSSETQAAKRDFIAANFPSATLYEDMVKRNHAEAPPHDLYICGFPCKPFSSLHHGSRFFKESEAKPFFATIKTLAAALPAVAVLENVPGIKRVLSKVWAKLRAIRHYTVFTFEANPAKMAEPVERPRVFFVLVRTDVAKEGAKEIVGRLVMVGDKPGHLRRATTERLVNDTVAVCRRAPASRGGGKTRRATASPRGGKTRRKWEEALSGMARVPVTLAPGCKLTERQQSLLEVLAARAGGASNKFNVDLSQGLGRSHVREICPTITPGGKIFIGAAQRTLSVWEKCLMHLIPVHDLVWPATLTDNIIGDMVGNTMHLMAARASVSPVPRPQQQLISGSSSCGSSGGGGRGIWRAAAAAAAGAGAAMAQQQQQQQRRRR